MKKILYLLCMITCVLSLGACGKNDTEIAKEQYEASNVEMAKNIAVSRILPLIEKMSNDADILSKKDFVTTEEMAKLADEAEHDVIVEYQHGYLYQTVIDNAYQDYIENHADGETDQEKLEAEARSFAEEQANLYITDYADQFNVYAEQLADETPRNEISGYAMISALNSFTSAYEKVGQIVEVESPENIDASVDGTSIVLNIDTTCEKGNAKVEMVFSNDRFLKLKSASLNPVENIKGLMKKAALNTLIGMGTVFAVLIFLVFVISAFNIFPYLQKKKDANKIASKGVDNAVNQISENEQLLLNNDNDDEELVAVIAAAVAAYEGSASTDGFIVRSIRRHF